MSDFTELVDLASERLGGAVLAANDEFFAPKENLLREDEPIWREGEYTERGKWMDGWETRRRREPGHDWCLIRLGLPGIVRGVVVDTTHFRGNFPEAFSLEAAALDVDPPAASGAGDPRFLELVPRTPLAGDVRNAFEIPPSAVAPRATHLVLRIYPDGGVARLRVHGEVVPAAPTAGAAGPDGEIDLAAVENGGRVLAASDMFFGHRHHLIYPGPPRGMFDGWETKRRRGPGHDWALVALGMRGRIRRVVVDTSFFKGNAPGACSIEGRVSSEVGGGVGSGDPADGEGGWRELLPRVPLAPDREHQFVAELAAHEPVDRVRLNIYPDGGVARLRLFGAPGPGTDRR